MSSNSEVQCTAPCMERWKVVTSPANNPLSSKNCTSVALWVRVMGAVSDHLQEDPWISRSMHEVDLQH